MAPPQLCEHSQCWLSCSLCLVADAPIQKVLQRSVQALIPLLLVGTLDVCRVQNMKSVQFGSSGAAVPIDKRYTYAKEMLLA